MPKYYNLTTKQDLRNIRPSRDEVVLNRADFETDEEYQEAYLNLFPHPEAILDIDPHLSKTQMKKIEQDEKNTCLMCDYYLKKDDREVKALDKRFWIDQALETEFWDEFCDEFWPKFWLKFLAIKNLKAIDLNHEFIKEFLIVKKKYC